MTYVYDASENPSRFRLCLFDKSSTRPCWFVDGRQMLDSVELFGNRNRLNYVSLSLMRAERLDNAWTCMNVTRALDDCSRWLVDTTEICSFFGRTPVTNAALAAAAAAAAAEQQAIEQSNKQQQQQQQRDTDTSQYRRRPSVVRQSLFASTQSIQTTSELLNSNSNSTHDTTSQSGSLQSAPTSSVGSISRQRLVSMATVSFASVAPRITPIQQVNSLLFCFKLSMFPLFIFKINDER